MWLLLHILINNFRWGRQGFHWSIMFFLLYESFLKISFVSASLKDLAKCNHLLYDWNFQLQTYWKRVLLPLICLIGISCEASFLSLLSTKKLVNEKAFSSLNGIKVRVFFEKNIEKKHLCRHDKNFYYFWKSNIPVINLTVGSRNRLNFQKIRVCRKIDKR